MDLIIRAFSAADVPVAFSQGYHPLPRVSFGPPLALGAAGRAEMFDASMLREWTPDIAAINAWLPLGLRINAVRTLPGKPVALSAAITAARYAFVPLVPLAKEYLASAVAQVLEQSEILLSTEKDTGIVVKDLRPLIHGLSVGSDAEGACVHATLSMLPSATCRPADLLAVLFPNQPVHDFKVVRLECLPPQ